MYYVYRLIEGLIEEWIQYVNNRSIHTLFTRALLFDFATEIVLTSSVSPVNGCLNSINSNNNIV